MYIGFNSDFSSWPVSGNTVGPVLRGHCLKQALCFFFFFAGGGGG